MGVLHALKVGKISKNGGMYPILNLIIVNAWAIIDKVCVRGTCVPMPEGERTDRLTRMAKWDEPEGCGAYASYNAGNFRGLCPGTKSRNRTTELMPVE